MDSHDENEGQRIRTIREQRGMNGKEFAGLLGVSGSFLSQVERGQRTASHSMLVALAERGEDVTWVLTGSRHKPWPAMLARWQKLKMSGSDKDRDFAGTIGAPYGEVWKKKKLKALKDGHEIVTKLLDLDAKLKLDDYSLDDDAHILVIASASLDFLARKDESSVWAIERLIDLILRANEKRPDDVPIEYQEEVDRELEEYKKEVRARREKEAAEAEKP